MLCNGVAMSVASREHMGNQSESNFYCFNTSTQQTLVVAYAGLPAVSRFTAFQTGPVRDSSAYTRNIAQNCVQIPKKMFTAGAPPQTPLGELTTLPQRALTLYSWLEIG